MPTRMLFHTHEFLALLIVTLTLFHLVPCRVVTPSCWPPR